MNRYMGITQKIKWIVITGAILSVSLLFSDNTPFGNFTLSWENPESGSAISAADDDEFDKMQPVDRVATKESRVELSITPKLEAFMIPVDGEDIVDWDTPKGKRILSLKAAEKARMFMEKKIHSLNINGTEVKINADCSSFVRAAFWEASEHTIDLFEISITSGASSWKTNSGVKIISLYYEKNHKIKNNKPSVGDVVLFDNTWDKNGNKKRDDWLTHIGIVTELRSDGTIEFIHGNVGKDEIKLGYINFKEKTSRNDQGETVNSYLRPKYSWEKDLDKSENLTQALVHGFGSF